MSKKVAGGGEEEELESYSEARRRRHKHEHHGSRSITPRMRCHVITDLRCEPAYSSFGDLRGGSERREGA